MYYFLIHKSIEFREVGLSFSHDRRQSSLIAKVGSDVPAPPPTLAIDEIVCSNLQHL